MEKENINFILRASKRNKIIQTHTEPLQKKAHTENTGLLNGKTNLDGSQDLKGKKKRKKNKKRKSTDEASNQDGQPPQKKAHTEDTEASAETATKTDAANTDGSHTQKGKKKNNKKNKKLNSHETTLSASGAEDAKKNASAASQAPLSNTPEAVAERKRIKTEKKHQRVLNDSPDQRAEIALEYLRSWKNDRSNWKFNKNRQVFLINNFLNTVRVPDSLFPDVTAYMESMKGAARDMAREIAQHAIALQEAQDSSDDVTDSETATTKKTLLKRARKVVKVLRD